MAVSGTLVDRLAAALAEAADTEVEPPLKGKFRSLPEVVRALLEVCAVGVVSAQISAEDASWRVPRY